MNFYRIKPRWHRHLYLAVASTIFFVFLNGFETAAAQSGLTEPEDVKQIEHPSNVPVADFFGGSYVDSTDDPSTGASAHNPANIDLAIGEEFNYIVTYTFPEGTTGNFIVIDVTAPQSGILPGSYRDRVIELLSAEVIHVGDNLSGPGIRAEGYNFALTDQYADGDRDRIQMLGTGSRDVINAADGVINILL